jgi:hypothetical protein
VRKRVVALLVAGTAILGVASIGSPGAGATTAATCAMAGVKVVGTSGGRYYSYALRVRMSNLTMSGETVTATVASSFSKTYSTASWVPALSTRYGTLRVTAPHGTTFHVTGCTASS